MVNQAPWHTMLCISNLLCNRKQTPSEGLFLMYQLFSFENLKMPILHLTSGFCQCDLFLSGCDLYFFNATYCRFASALGGLAANEIIQRTTDRLETIHSEGVHVCGYQEKVV